MAAQCRCGTQLRHPTPPPTLTVMNRVALLRGINLGATRKVPMADLRQVLATEGYGEVKTHLRSGNVVFASDEPAGLLGDSLRETISSEFGMDVAVVVRTAEQMQAIVDSCSYLAAAEEDPKKIHVTFLDPMPERGVWADVDPDAYAPGEYAVGEGVVYLHLPNGMARTKLPATVEKAARGCTATTRNWRTVTALLEMLEP